MIGSGRLAALMLVLCLVSCSRLKSGEDRADGTLRCDGPDAAVDPACTTAEAQQNVGGQLPAAEGGTSSTSEVRETGGEGAAGASGKDADVAGAGGSASAGQGGMAATAEPDPCATNHGGCDLLAGCTARGADAACGPCPGGYRDERMDGTRCVDIDECKAGGASCVEHASCKNLPGSYACQCDPGYNGDGHKSCLKNVLCNADGSSCAAAASCKDLGGARYCVCKDGYAGDGASCSDIDECASGNGGCGDAKLWSCANNPGAAPSCSDIDECASGNGGCGDARYWTCKNNRGAAPTCSDIDECKVDNGGCGSDVYVRCVNNSGAAPSCNDIDECATNNGGCGDAKHWVCKNKQGAAPGCEDLDECQVNNGGCSKLPKATCFNNVGAAPSCKCPSGDPGDGITCARFVPDPTVVDDYTTGLEWGRQPQPGTYTWAEASGQCGPKLSGAGWRLPTLDELLGIVDKSKTPTIDPDAFPSTPPQFFWTSTPFIGQSYYYVDFASGSSGATSTDANDKLYVRCVRQGPLNIQPSP